MANSSKKQDFLVVGIGASAGGVEVLKSFVKKLPEKPGYAIVIVQHLAPDHESMMPELLGRLTKIPVSAVESEERVYPDHIYVIPPNCEIEIDEGHLQLSARREEPGGKETIDRFFRSLAKERKTLSVGVIFSGAGSDGTAGLRAIKSAGGLALVQDPETAAYSSMPLSAISTNIVDEVLPVDDIPDLLATYSKHPYARDFRDAPEQEDSEINLHDITALLDHHEGLDLRQYKPATILRRITRRMSLLGVEKYPEYLDKVRREEDERRNLTKDLLIKVTDFFRDASAYEILEREAIIPLVASLPPGEELRVWIPGCASGEEAYSLTMVILDCLRKAKKSNNVRVFATDIDEDSIDIARRGVYPPSIVQEIPENVLEKYFTRLTNEQYQIKQRVRDCISFAKQNVASDPPFSHIHLISCRNLLIYLKKNIQSEILKYFYFSLVPKGILFLGSSEHVGDESLFKAISKKWRIYRKLPGTDKKRLGLFRQLGFKTNMVVEKESQRGKSKKETPTRNESLFRSIIDTCIPAVVIVSKGDKVIYQHGALKEYLEIPEGEPTNDFYSLLRSDLRTRIRSCAYKARKSSTTQSIRCRLSSEMNTFIEVKASPLEETSQLGEGVLVITFKKTEAKPQVSEEALSRSSDSETIAQELAETKEELQNTIEELETSSEELKASHEEALSTNEELQSANEELESSSEELRSLNEELSTTNEQLKDKVRALRQAKDDINNFFESTNVATIFVDEELKIQRFTPAAEELLKISKNDQGRSIATLPTSLLDECTISNTKKVFQSLQPFARELSLEDGRWFNCQITPYRTEDRRVNGTVLVFQDITELKKLSERALNREQQQAVIAKLGYKALTEDDIDAMMGQVVRQVAHVLDVEYCKILKYQPKENNLLLVAGVGWEPGLVGKATVPDKLDSQAGYTLSELQPVIVKDLRTEKRFQGPSLLTEHRVVSGISCIINHNKPPFGVLGVHTKKRREFTEDDVNFVRAVANLLSTALKAKQAVEDLRLSEARLQAAKNTARMGVHEWHIEENRVYWDRTVREIWGAKEDEPITFETFIQGVHPDDIEKTNEAVKNALDEKGDGVYFAEYRVVHRNTKFIRWVEATGTVFYEEGKAKRLVGMVVDVTEHKQLTAKLEEAIEALKSVDANKNNFLSMLGHELRNPLAVVDGCLEEIEDESTEENRTVEIAKRNVAVMTRLLDDLLDLARVSTNRVKIIKRPMDLAPALREIVDSTKQRFEEKGCRLNIVTEPLPVEGDRIRLGQVFSNVLGNALKYSPKGSSVQVQAKRRFDKAVVTVTDDGPGIEVSEQKKIFEAFYQVKKGSFSGLGIGLALAKQIVDLHGGEISCTSEGAGKGATFTIEIPTIPKELVSGGVKVDVNEALKGLTVGVVDDNIDLAETTKSSLKRRGVQVSVFYDGEEGLAFAKSSPPDVMLIDLQLPGKTGYEIAAEIRERRGGDSTPLLIAVSGFAHEDARAKASESGFDHHLAKPIDMTEFAELVANHRDPGKN